MNQVTITKANTFKDKIIELIRNNDIDNFSVMNMENGKISIDIDLIGIQYHTNITSNGTILGDK